MGKHKIKDYAILFGAFLVYSASTVCARLASHQDIFVKVLVFMGLELVCLAFYALIWQQALGRFTLVAAMACKGSVVLINLIWSVLLFSEKITIYNLAGALVIMAGIAMVCVDDPKKREAQ